MAHNSAHAFTMPKRLIIAIGGNATHPETIKGTADEQVEVMGQTAVALLPLARLDTELIITHGNGPVVGKILMRQTLTRDRIPPMPLDICVAHSQGGIGYLLAQALDNALRVAGHNRTAACVLTQVEVDANDQAFQNPTKFVGTFFTEAQAQDLTRELGWHMVQDGARGWRHVVPSPKPLRIGEISLINLVAKQGSIVIAGGGGGIPVVRDATGSHHGVAAVIDKDLTTTLMALELGIDTIMLLTAVPKVSINFGKPNQSQLDTVTLRELKAYNAAGHFPPGSMGPKMDAAIGFIEGGGKRVVIGQLDQAVAALEGRTGTHVVPD
jgi:carbamate kinase